MQLGSCIWGHIWGQVLYFAAIRNRHADRGAWMRAAHDTHGYSLAEIAAAVGLQDTRPDPYCVLTLGSEPNGKPITSLTLALESETKAEDDDGGTTLSDRERYSAHDAIASQILEGLKDPFAKRGELAKAVMGEIASEVRDDDPNKFKKALRAYSAHLTRLSKAHTLWPYIDEKNDKGQALTFRNPKHRGRRAAKQEAP